MEFAAPLSQTSGVSRMPLPHRATYPEQSVLHAPGVVLEFAVPSSHCSSKPLAFGVCTTPSPQMLGSAHPPGQQRSAAEVSHSAEIAKVPSVQPTEVGQHAWLQLPIADEEDDEDIQTLHMHVCTVGVSWQIVPVGQSSVSIQSVSPSVSSSTLLLQFSFAASACSMVVSCEIVMMVVPSTVSAIIVPRTITGILPGRATVRREVFPSEHSTRVILLRCRGLGISFFVGVIKSNNYTAKTRFP